MKIFPIFLIMLLGPLNAYAQQKSTEGTLLSSPKCDAAKIQSIAGEALRKIQPAPWEGSFYIVLNESILSYQELTRRMVQEGCY